MTRSVIALLILLAPSAAIAGPRPPQPLRDRPHFHVAQLLPHDIPDLCAGSADNVPAGQNVTLTGKQDKGCIGIPSGSTLTLGANLDLTVTTILCKPGGRLVTDGAIPLSQPSVVTFRDAATNPSTDPNQWGTGLVSMCETSLRGETTATYARMTAELAAGATQVQLKSLIGMRVGGELMLLESRFIPEGAGASLPQLVTITALDATTNTATFTPANAVLRRAARNWDRTIKEYPEVAYVTRALTFRSQNPNGTRAHTVFTGAGAVDVRYVAFLDLGRTLNHLTAVGSQMFGRYTLHVHHKMTDSTLFEGNVMLRGRKWGGVAHQSSRVTFLNNIVGLHQGFCLGTEDGVNEADVVFNGNLVTHCTGDGRRGDAGEAEWHSNPLAIGTTGAGFWIKGPGVTVVNNRCYSMLTCFWQWGVRDDGRVRLGTWDRNECWSGSLCVEFWYVAGGIISNQFVANMWGGTNQYATWRITYRDWVIRGDPDLIAGTPALWAVGIQHGDYYTRDTVIERADIQNMSIGIRPAWAIAQATFGEGHIPLTYRIVDSSFCNNLAGDVYYYVLGGSEPWTVKPPNTVIVENASHCSQSATWVAATGQLTQNATETVPVVKVVNHNRVPNDNFDVHSSVHAPGGTTTRARILDRVSGSGPPPVAVDCQVSAFGEWSAWVAISPTTEQRTRTRTVTTHPANGGAPCPPLTETETRPIDQPPPPAGLTVAYAGQTRDLVSPARALTPDGVPDETLTVTFPDAVAVTRFRLEASAGGSWDTGPTGWVIGVSLSATTPLINTASGAVSTTAPVFHLYGAHGGVVRFPPGSTATVTATVAGVDVTGTVTVAGPPPSPVDCQVSPWSAYTFTAWAPINATTEQRTGTRTRTVTQPPSGGGAACPALAETITETRPIPTSTITIVVDIQTCRYTVTDTLPTSETGWGVQFERRLGGVAGTWVNHGARDTSAPYSRSANLTSGAWEFRSIWTRTGSPTVIGSAVAVPCGK